MEFAFFDHSQRVYPDHARPATLIFTLLMPIIQMVLLGYAATAT